MRRLPPEKPVLRGSAWRERRVGFRAEVTIDPFEIARDPRVEFEHPVDPFLALRPVVLA